MSPNPNSARWLLAAIAIPLSIALANCSAPYDVQLYVALDQQHSESLVRRFEAQTGLHVRARFDTEASKTVGLVSAIIEESGRPRCDVFWNNELAHTVRLAQKGLLESYDSPSASAIPAKYRAADNAWTGFAARARIFIVNKAKIPNTADYPKSIWDLTNPKWKGRCAIARPLTGTSLTHFTALRIRMGKTRFAEFLQGLHKNEVLFLQSNGATMRQTAAGRVDFALTDTDDFHVALTKGHDVAAVFPDQGDSEMGTMLIPNSVAIIKGCRHPESARKLVDFILSEEVEGLLAAARSAQIPLREGVPGPKEASILTVGKFKHMRWDPAATARDLQDAAAFFAKEFNKASRGG
jgi:iron(III) transport system substrate-binding protein